MPAIVVPGHEKHPPACPGTCPGTCPGQQPLLSTGPCAHSLWKTLWTTDGEWGTTGGEKPVSHSGGTVGPLPSHAQPQFLWTTIWRSPATTTLLPSVHRTYD